MKLLICGDVHANIKLFSEIVNSSDCDAVLQCGDLGVFSLKDFINWGYLVDKAGHYDITGAKAPITDITNSKIKFNKPVYFITGNHENFDLFDTMNANGEFDGGWNMNYIPYNSPKEINGITVSGLSGCYSYKVFTGGVQKGKSKIKVKPETPPEVEEYLSKLLGKDPRGRFTHEQTEEVKKQKSDILLLHEIPRGVRVESMFTITNDTGCSALNEIIDEMKPKYVFCGHWHKYSSTELGDAIVITLKDILKGWLILDTETWGIERVDL